MNFIFTDFKQESVCVPAKSNLLNLKVLIAFALFLFFSAHLMAQVAPTSFTIVTETPVQSNYSIAGYSNGGNYSTGTTYNLRFGRNSSNGAGTNRKVSTFVVSGFTYKPIPRASGLPYSKVVLSRKANPEVTDLNKQSVFFENTGALDGTTLYYVPEYAGTMEALINSFIVNRGTDNVFSNTNGITLNTVRL